MSSEPTPSKGVAEFPTCITASSSASEVVDFFRMSSWLMDLSVDQKTLTDRENALDKEIQNLKKAKESMREFENWKMRAKQEIEELKKTGKKEEVEERLEASEKRSVVLNKRVARMEENGSYAAVKLAAENGGLATFSAQNHLGPIATKKEAGNSTVSDLSLKPQKVGSGAWVDQNEMRLAFVNDPELCMNAVCALYRNLIFSPLSNDQFGVELAKYLIDGNPENKLNRPMSEISNVVAEESIWLALKYSEQLFRIYSSGEDPQFCHNSTSSKH